MRSHCRPRAGAVAFVLLDSLALAPLCTYAPWSASIHIPARMPSASSPRPCSRHAANRRPSSRHLPCTPTPAPITSASKAQLASPALMPSRRCAFGPSSPTALARTSRSLSYSTSTFTALPAPIAPVSAVPTHTYVWRACSSSGPDADRDASGHRRVSVKRSRQRPDGTRQLSTSSRCGEDDEGSADQEAAPVDGEDVDGEGEASRRVKLSNLDEEYVSLDSVRRHYLTRVLRMRDGALVESFDGAGRSRVYELRLDGRRSAALVAAAEVVVHSDPVLSEEGGGGCVESGWETRGKVRVAMWLPVLRRDRMEWAVEKLTELGCLRLNIYRPHRCRVGSVDFERLLRIRDEAERQCRRYHEMDIQQTTRGIDAFLEGSDMEQRSGGVWLEPGSPHSLSSMVARHALVAPSTASNSSVPAPHHHLPSLHVLIGPEGGFAPQEREQLRWSLGEPAHLDACAHILKADTAALAAFLITISATSTTPRALGATALAAHAPHD